MKKKKYTRYFWEEIQMLDNAVESMLVGGLEFSPNMALVAMLLPDVNYVQVEFEPALINDPYYSHRATIVRFIFESGARLSVPGYMLWQYLDSIPDDLGSNSYGFSDENKFSTDHPEALMRRVRAAYNAMFAMNGGGICCQPPIAATLSIFLKDFVVDYAKSLLGTSVIPARAPGQ